VIADVRLVLVLVLLLPAEAPQSKPLDYRAALEAYRAGDTAAAIAAVDHLNRKQIDREFKLLVAEETIAKQAGRPRVWLWTAAMLHLEGSLAAERIFDRAAADRGAVQLELAWKFASALYPDLRYEAPSRRETEKPGSDAAFLRAWFRFMVTHDIARRWHNIVQQDIDLALRMTVGDPDILLAQGALHEVTWHDRHEEGREHLTPFPADLAVAERALRAAVDADPGLVEARVRLGRVQTMRGESADALRTLAALGPGTEPGFLYLARLFEGDVHETVGDLAAADRAYGEAMAVMPAAQSAQIARAHVRHTAGHRDEAIRDVVALAQAASLIADDDPWLIYRHGSVWRLAGYLDTLRQMVRQ
jgi:tetratricopeptide repeat protein